MTYKATTPPLTGAELDKQRELFEAHFGPKDNFAWRTADDKYKVPSLQSAWEIWQAAVIAQARAQQAGAAPAIVGHAELNRFMDGYCNSKPELMACAQAAMFFFNACARAAAESSEVKS